MFSIVLGYKNHVTSTLPPTTELLHLKPMLNLKGHKIPTTNGINPAFPSAALLPQSHDAKNQDLA